MVTDQHAIRPPIEARAPARPEMPPLRGEKQSVIRWRAVAIGGGTAWLLVGCLMVGVGAIGQGNAKARMLANTLEQTADVRERTGPGRASQRSREPAAVPEKQDASVASVSFQKPPACPPLPHGQEESVNPNPILPVSEQGLGGLPVTFEQYGTQVAFASSPSEAARQAARDRKLLYILHLSGNFEDAKFT